jgi:hypothetical protein
MKKMAIPAVYGLTVFCDDIRGEVDGKVTYVGVYNGNMVFGVPFPVQMPKLGIAVTLVLASEEDANFSFQVYLPGDQEGTPSITFDAPGEAIRNGISNTEMAKDDPRFALKVNGVFSPFVLSKEGYVEVRAVRNGEYLRVGRLKVSSTVASISEKNSPP